MQSDYLLLDFLNSNRNVHKVGMCNFDSEKNIFSKMYAKIRTDKLFESSTILLPFLIKEVEMDRLREH